MKIVIIGTGYVGLVSGACFADMGMDVVCVDEDHDKIERLKQGDVPIYEPGLEDIISRNAGVGRLSFDTDIAARLKEAEVLFCAVGTPPDKDGNADISNILNVARTAGREMNDYLLFVTKSTVPVGTAEKVRETIREGLDKRDRHISFDVACNPEFLKEGSAVNDFMRPDRVVVGVESERSRSLMEKVYAPFMIINYRMIFTDLRSAEMIKYAANAMLATRISFMNDMANLCALTGADINMVRKGIGSDPRIGNKFLYSGAGYGGSCFPKDVKALIRTGEEYGYEMKVVKAVHAVNEKQKTLLFEKLQNHFDKNISGKTIAVWGLSFKPETDDIRDAPAITLAEALLRAGARIRVYDPVAMDNVRQRFGESITYCHDKYSASEGADALVIATEWKEFRVVDWERVKALLKTPLVIDGRNIYNPAELTSQHITYDYVGI